MCSEIQSSSIPEEHQQHPYNIAINAHQLHSRTSIDGVDYISRKSLPLNSASQPPEGLFEGQVIYDEVSCKGNTISSSNGGGAMEMSIFNGSLPRNFGGKEEKVRPVAKVQAQVMKRATTTQQSSPSPVLKAPPLINHHQQPQYVNFGHLNNSHNVYYGPDINASYNGGGGSLTRNMNHGGGNTIINNLVNTRAEIHHHDEYSQTSLSSIPCLNLNSHCEKVRKGGGE